MTVKELAEKLPTITRICSFEGEKISVVVYKNGITLGHGFMVCKNELKDNQVDAVNRRYWELPEERRLVSAEYWPDNWPDYPRDAKRFAHLIAATINYVVMLEKNRP